LTCHRFLCLDLVDSAGLQNLRLREEGRQLVGKDIFSKRDGEIQVYLFDHAIVFTKAVKTKQHEQFKVYRRVRFSRFLPSIGMTPVLLAHTIGTSVDLCT